MDMRFNLTQRIHAFDALRAAMMLLGLVLHSSEPYTLGADAYWPKDPYAQGIFQNYLNSLIHVFRMPVFFLMAGFFGSLLFYKRNIGSMMKNRFSRITLPFALFLLLLHPAISWAARFTAGRFHTVLSNSLMNPTIFPKVTYHLWFLYYLIIITSVAIVLAMVLKRIPRISSPVVKSFNWLVKHQLAFILLHSILVFLMLVWIWDTWVPTSISFLPDYKILIFYLLFYSIGWLLFKSRDLLVHMMSFDRIFLFTALLIFTTKYIFWSEIGDVIYGALNALIIWLFVFGYIGIFLRHANSHSAVIRYISDASYWVYLVHLPFTLFIPGLLVDLHIPAFFKFLIVLLLTTLACFLSYHYLVRATWIGEFLNGRRYPVNKLRMQFNYRRY